MIYLGRGIVAFAAITASAVGVAIVRDWSQMLTGIVIGVCAVALGVVLGQVSGGLRVRLYEREAGHRRPAAGHQSNRRAVRHRQHEGRPLAGRGRGAAIPPSHPGSGWAGSTI